ncbi:hypothetical protein B0T19DRAFT_352359 [Cercophora scortea]|uniref:Uncharacterized protein n=1 Tax=Cercophora scortea TaxID=314031 RepID=A0AAE0IUL2_9PEZI|nr:hypothetical protein B0T19DRAFT_352359 [Cercophora scortea]
MAASHLGDLVKFAELGWKIYDYGWSEEWNANLQYIEFGSDVKHLANCLRKLSGVITEAQNLFCNPQRGLLTVGDLDWDNATLLDIIGDYDATLNECLQLVKTNKRYAAMTGPGANLGWNILVRPKVDRLRARIVLHSSKIQHVLEPFKIDLYLRIHSDLARRIQGVHDNVLKVHESVREVQGELQALIAHLNPALVQNTHPQSACEIPRVDVPAPIWQGLEDAFVDRDADGLDFPPLRDIADAFITHFNMSTRHFCPEPNQGTTSPPLRQYLALVTCQFLMDKMFGSPEYHVETQTSSHWPRYIKSLQQHLSAECLRFNQDMTIPDTAGPDGCLSVPPIWKREELPSYIESANVPVAMDHLLDLQLQNPHPRRWRRLKLLRICDSADRKFRLVITAGNQNRPASETRPVNFDIRTACLIPRYATHDGRDGPLEMVLRVGDELHPLVFCSRADLYRFQQALTGYEVVDRYMEYGLQVVFVMGLDGKVMEYASLQLWRPSRLEGERVIEDSDDTGYNDGDGRKSSTSSSETIRLSRSTTTPISFSRNSPQRSRSSYAMQTPDHSLFRAQAGEGPAEERSLSPTDLTGSFTAWPPQLTSTNDTIRQQPQRKSRLSLSSISNQARNMPPIPTSPVSTQTNLTRYRNSLPNGTSTANSMRSSMSTASYATRSVSVVGTSNVATTGTLHCKPTEPLLVLFTQSGGSTNAHGIVAVALDHTTGCNYSACQCISRPLECRVAALERGSGGNGPLNVIRLSGNSSPLPSTSQSRPAQWDILPLSEPLRSQRASRASRAGKTWRKVIRISICFERMELRRHFAGMPCDCPATTEGELIDCLARWDRGRLGLVKEAARREWEDWHYMRFRNQTDIVVDQRLLPGRG